MGRSLARLAAAALVLLTGLSFAQAQISEEDQRENSRIIRFIEDELSSENRIIRLRGVDGLLASNARVAEITVADREGVWLTISEASILWSRLALFEGRVKIDEMTAARIDVARAPLPEEAAITPETEPIVIPDLPLSVEIGKLSVPEVTLGEPLVGIAATLGIEGRLNLISGGIDTDVSITRKDGPGGRLALLANYEPEGRQLAIKFEAAEPVGGLMATALGLDGKPSVELFLAGQGPVDDLDMSLRVATAGEERITGRATVRPAEDGTAFDARVSGDLEPFVGPDMAELITGGSELAARGVIPAAGGVQIEAMRLASGLLFLEGGLATTADGFLSSAVLSGRYGDGTGPAPLPGASEGSITGADLAFRFGGSDSWELRIDATDLIVGDFRSAALALTGDGTIEGIETPGDRAISGNISANLGGLSSSNPALTRAMGRNITLNTQAEWRTGAAFTLEKLTLAGRDLDLTAAGVVKDFAFEGDISARADRIERFSALAGRRLGGKLDLDLSGRISPLVQSFDLELDGSSDALRVGQEIADRLLAGVTRLSGRVTRDETGFQTRGLKVENRQIRLASNGLISSALSDFNFTASLQSLRLLGLDAQGRVSAQGTVEGEAGLLAITSRITVPEGEAMGRALEGLKAGFTGNWEDDTLSGDLSGSGALGGEPVSLSGRVGLRADGQSLNDLQFSVSENAITGSVIRNEAGLMSGNVDVAAPDIAALAALFFREASGEANAELVLQPGRRGQDVLAYAFLNNAEFGGASIGGGALSARVENAFGIPSVSGTLRFNTALLGGVAISQGSLQADRAPDGGTDFRLIADVTQDNRLSALGGLTETPDGFDVSLEELRLANGETLLDLDEAASLKVRGSDLEIDRLTLRSGEGLLSLGGSIAEVIALDAQIDALPLSIVNAFRPDLGLFGALSGEAKITGARDAPDIAFTTAIDGLTSTTLQAADLPPVALTAAGESSEGRLNVESEITGPGDFSARIDGSVPMGDGEMALAGQLDRFPLALIDRLAGRRGLSGRVSGTFGVAGSYALPRIRFSVSSPSINANVLTNNGISPIAVSAEGSFADNRLVLADGRLRNDGGMDIVASGRLPLALDGLNFSVRGQVPLGAVGFALARAGFRGDGILDLAIRATGRLSDPQINGTAALNDATLLIPALNLRLNDLDVDADLLGERLAIRSATANNAGGGTVSASGDVTLDPVQGFPADLALALRDFRYTDGRMASARLGGDLQINGPIARDGTLSGRFGVEQLEFRIPEALGAADSYRLNVTHLALPNAVNQTLQRARMIGTETREERSERGLRLDILFDAPSRVFVRGRGLDAELGGQITLGGTVRGLKPVGQFDLIRGRFAILGQRLDLTSGAASFDGDPLPVLSLKARTQVEDVEATISVEGRANEPQVELSSVPELPDDEILAQIVFRRAMSDLSALQVARLAAALAELSGRGGIGFFEQVRSATGLDDLDFETTDDGATTVRAGKYLNENLYSTVEADTEGGSRASIVLDLSDHMTARGTVDNNGETTFGVFFEKDY